MATLLQIATDAASRLNRNISDSTVKARLYRHINDECKHQWTKFPWSFRKREYHLMTFIEVTSGTLTATNNSQVVTASGTPFNSARHVGAYINFLNDSDTKFYKILSVTSTSSVVLHAPYKGTTGSGKSYELKSFDYALPMECREIQWASIPNLRPSLDICEGYGPAWSNVGIPYALYIGPETTTTATYTTGTVTGSINTTTLTGSATVWTSNVLPGDELVISGDTNTYIVRSVTSDTGITLYQNLQLAAATASYTITRRNQRTVRLYPSPAQDYIIIVLGLRDYAPLINDSDSNELTRKFDPAILEGVIRREMGSAPDQREGQNYQLADSMWIDAREEDRALTQRSAYRTIWNPRG